MNIEELIDRICNAEYTCPDIMKPQSTTTQTIVSRYSSAKEQKRAAISEAVYRWFAANQEYQEVIKLKQEIAEYKAAVHVYERIIANSNFQPLLKEEPNGQERTDEHIIRTP